MMLFDLFFKNARKQYETRHLISAGLWFDILERFSPKSKDVRHYLGLINFKNKNYEKSVTEFLKILEDDSKYPHAYYNLALSYQMLNKIEDAKKYYNKAIDFDKNDFESYYNLGVIYFNEGLYDIALNFFTKANEVSPDRILTLFYIINCKDNMIDYTTLSQGEMIINEYMLLQNRHKSIKNYYSTIATVYAKIGDINNCKKFCKMALDEDIYDVQCYRLLGLVSLIEGKIEKSKIWINLGMKIEPNDYQLKDMLLYIE